MPFITRPGKPTLHYQVDDFSDPWRKAGTIVLQHGYGRSTEFWYSWIPYLARYYRILRIDLRGHGQSAVDFDPATESTLENYLEDLLAVLDRSGLDAVHYCGESFGGILGMALAAKHPSRVLTLSLVAAPVYQNQASQDAFAAGYPSREEALRALGARKWAEQVYDKPQFFPAGSDRAMREWYFDQIGKNNVEVLCGLYGLLRHASARDLLPLIEAPVLALYPTSGSITSSEQEDLLVAGVRHLRIVHLPTASHFIQTLNPAACATEVLHFAGQRDGIACHE